MSLICLTVLLLLQQPPSESKAQIWAAALRKAFAKEDVSVFMDVDLSLPAPDLDKCSFAGGQRMKVIAALTQTSWKQLNNVQLFDGPKYDGPIVGARDSEKGIAWLLALSEPDLKAMVGEGLRFEDVPSQSQAYLAGLVNGQLPPMAALLASAPQNVEITLSVQPTIVVKKPGGGERTIPIVTNRNHPTGITPDPLLIDAPKTETIPLEPGPQGSLDFGEGDVLQLREILTKVQKAFGRRYVVDHRLAESYYFVKGSFDNESFASCLEQLGKVQPPKPASTPEEARNILKAALKGQLGEQLANSGKGDPAVQEALKLMDKPNLTANDAIRISPDMERFLTAAGVSRGDSIELRFGIAVAINAPGFSSIPGTASKIEGVVRGATRMRNYVGLVISP